MTAGEALVMQALLDIKTEIGDIKGGMGDIKGDVGYIKGKIVGVCNDNTHMHDRMDRMQAQCLSNHPQAHAPRRRYGPAPAPVHASPRVTAGQDAQGVADLVGAPWFKRLPPRYQVVLYIFASLTASGAAGIGVYFLLRLCGV